MVVMFTVGGAISGYSDTGSARCAIAPIIVSRMESTAANTGRSMKKCEKRMVCPQPEVPSVSVRRGIGCEVDGAFADFDKGAGPHKWVSHSGDDDPGVFRQ